MAKKIILVLIIMVAILVAGFFYFRYQAYNFGGPVKKSIEFEIVKGERTADIAQRLAQEDLIVGKYQFLYYLKTSGRGGQIIPGRYNLSSIMRIPEIVDTITNKEKIIPNYVKITFPEGWDSKKMSERLTANGFDGQQFLEIVKNSSAELKNKYLYPEDKNITTLEGYLFPDTYFLKPETSAENIIGKMLDNFNSKITEQMKNDIKSQNKTLKDIIILASIIEKEVNTDEDRALVSGIFWNRIKVGQALQSCATLAYILGVNKKQYSYADTQTPSSYNTYLNAGLTPGPISNPGLSSIKATIYPKDSSYNYFLSDPETGKTYFASTLEEHNANKVKYGL